MAATAPRRATAPRYYERWTYDARIFAAALIVAAPALALLVVAMAWRDIPTAPLVALGVVAVLLTLWAAVRLRNRVIYPLYTLSNLLEALREGDFSLRGSRARRGDPIGEVVWEINALSQTLRDQRHRVEETNALLGKVIGAIDIAIFTFDAERRLLDGCIVIINTGVVLLDQGQQPGCVGTQRRGSSARDGGQNVSALGGDAGTQCHQVGHEGLVLLGHLTRCHVERNPAQGVESTEMLLDVDDRDERPFLRLAHRCAPAPREKRRSSSVCKGVRAETTTRYQIVATISSSITRELA